MEVSSTSHVSLSGILYPLLPGLKIYQTLRIDPSEALPCNFLCNNPISMALHTCLLNLNSPGPCQVFLVSCFLLTKLTTIYSNTVIPGQLILFCLFQFQVVSLHFHANQKPYMLPSVLITYFTYKGPLWHLFPQTYIKTNLSKNCNFASES